MNITSAECSRKLFENKSISPLKNKLNLNQYKTVQYYCQFQICSLGILDLHNNYLSTEEIRKIAQYVFRFIDNQFINNQKTVLKIGKKSSFLETFRYINETCCLFKSKRVLGVGRTKKVYEGIQVKINNNRDISSIEISSVAISYVFKNLNIAPNSQNKYYKDYAWNAAVKEDNMTKLFSSPYIVKKAFYHFKTERALVFVSKKLTASFNTILNKGFMPFQEQLLLAASDAAEALAEIHGKGKIHGDIKAENLCLKAGASILNKPFLAKPFARKSIPSTFVLRRTVLLDLGFMKDINVPGHGVQLSLLFAAPELVDNPNKKVKYDYEYFKNEPTFATDLWAFGLFLFQIFTNGYPYFLTNVNLARKLCFNLISIRKDPEYNERLFEQWIAQNQFEKDIQEVIRKLLSIDPAERGTTEEISHRLKYIYSTYSPIDLKRNDLLEALMIDTNKLDDAKLFLLKENFSVKPHNSFLAYPSIKFVSDERTSLMKSAPTSWSSEEESSDLI